MPPSKSPFRPDLLSFSLAAWLAFAALFGLFSLAFTSFSFPAQVALVYGLPSLIGLALVALQSRNM